MPDMGAMFKIFKVIFILIFISFVTLTTEQAAAPQRRRDTMRTCLNYGHACWGAHGKRGADKNVIVQKLMSLREPIETKILQNPDIKQSLVSSQWISNLLEMYERRIKNTGSDRREKGMTNSFPTNTNNNEYGDVLSDINEPLYALRILQQNPTTKLNDRKEFEESSLDYIN